MQTVRGEKLSLDLPGVDLVLPSRQDVPTGAMVAGRLWGQLTVFSLDLMSAPRERIYIWRVV